MKLNVKALLLALGLVSLYGADNLVATNGVALAGTKKVWMTNSPVYVGTLPDPEPCPYCHRLHHDFQLLQMGAYPQWYLITEAEGQRKTNIVYTGPTTNWLVTNIVARSWRPQPTNTPPPPLP